MAKKYFEERYDIRKEKKELNERLHELRAREEAERRDYLNTITSLIQSRPGMTANQYAMFLTDDPDEQERIAISIGGMGHMAEAARRKTRTLPFYSENEDRIICECPSIPTLERARKTVTRHFIEVDDNGTPIGKMEMEQSFMVYSISEN